MIETFKSYCNSLTRYSRYKTREVFIGSVPLGGNNPIRIQSMTTTDTMNTIATVEQTIRMVNAGCEYVRITAPSKLEAENLAEIKKELKKRGCTVPLIADIHFTPNAAEIAAHIVEKVRINPGNYADKKKFESIEYTDLAYEVELERIRKKFTPLVKICKEYGTAMRIGTNHGSLSDRIMSRYGDTPRGMVESALEYLRICEDNNFYSIVLSMKASNPQVMVQAYRLLIQKMEAEKMNYPLHLGVTEAGGGEDGRIKSALGIGALLEDGIGDTIRVSLTEDPEFEVPVAITLVNRYIGRVDHSPIKEIKNPPFNPYVFEKRKTHEIMSIGGSNVPQVVSDFSNKDLTASSLLSAVGYTYDSETDKWALGDTTPDLIYFGNQVPKFALPGTVKALYDYSIWQKLGNKFGSFPLLTAAEYFTLKTKSSLYFVQLCLNELNENVINKLKENKNTVIILTASNLHGMAEQRRFFFELVAQNITAPVIIRRNYDSLNFDELRLYTSTDLGGLLIDGYGDGVWISVDNLSENAKADGVYVKSFVNKKESKEKIINRISFGILQAARVRISKTEYIACPSCGRTLFDLQETTEKIRRRTEHLKGVKIAVMGCIVNGPGEMADADYGYVGSGVGKITLYKGKDIVKRNIAAKGAVESLIEIIMEDDNWVEPV